MPVFLLKFMTAGWFAANNPSHDIYALYVHILSWVMQIGAHKVFEGRAPALLDSVTQGACSVFFKHSIRQLF